MRVCWPTATFGNILEDWTDVLFVLWVIWAAFQHVHAHMYIRGNVTHFHECKPYRAPTLFISVTELCTCIFVFACMHEHVGCVFERYCVYVCVSGGQILQMGPDGSLNLWRCGTDSVWAFCNARMQHRPPRCACVHEEKTCTTVWLWFFLARTLFVCKTNQGVCCSTIQVCLSMCKAVAFVGLHRPINKKMKLLRNKCLHLPHIAWCNTYTP